MLAASYKVEGGIGGKREEQRLGPHRGREHKHRGVFFPGLGEVTALSCQQWLMGKISHLFQMLLDFANDTEEGLDFFFYLSDDSAPKTLFVPLNSGFADNEVSSRDEQLLEGAWNRLSEPQRRTGVHQRWRDGDVKQSLGEEEDFRSEGTAGCL